MPDPPYRSQEITAAKPSGLAVSEQTYRPRSRAAMRARVHVPLWGSLLAMYAGIWLHQPLFSLAALPVIFGMLGYNLVRRRKMVRLFRASDEGVAMLNSGDLVAAGNVFDALASQAANVPIAHALFVFNRGVTYMREGRTDRAIELISRAHDSKWLENKALGVAPLIASGLGTCYAIKGELDAAERWQREAHAQVAPAKRGMLMVLDAVIECRRGRFADAAGRIANDWSLGEGSLNAAQLRSLRLLRAFAMEQTGGDDAEIAKIIEGARPFRSGEQDYLAVSWPEYRAFLVKHGFVA